jgi:hypothetical protein
LRPFHVGADLGAAQPEQRHGAPELVRRPRRVLHRQRGEAHEAVRLAAHDRGEFVVLQRRANGAKRRLLAVEERLHRRAHELHGDAVAIHVAQPEVEIEDLARHRPLHDLAGDLHDHAPVLVDQLRRDARRFLGKTPDRLLGQHVGVHVDRDWGVHGSFDRLAVQISIAGSFRRQADA